MQRKCIELKTDSTIYSIYKQEDVFLKNPDSLPRPAEDKLRLYIMSSLRDSGPVAKDAKLCNHWETKGGVGIWGSSHH